MDTRTVIEKARGHLSGMAGQRFDQVELSKPKSQFEALNLLKITSKLSPIIGNLFEIDAVETLTAASDFDETEGAWVRQDPGFPDVLFQTGEDVEAGFEVKAWYPFSTEITGRFKDSQSRFSADQTHVVIFAWLPEHLLYGRPKIIDMVVVSARSVAEARDRHYHNPPDYLVIEPGDTAQRTRNLRQTNTSGHKWQASKNAKEEAGKLTAAREVIAAWGEGGGVYRPDRDYQDQVRQLRTRFDYRLDTNYGKMDRVVHAGIEDFKGRVMSTAVEGRTVADWLRLFRRGKNTLADVLRDQFRITASGRDPSLNAAPEPPSST